MTLDTEPSRRSGQSFVYWISLVLAAAAMIVIIVRVVLDPRGVASPFFGGALTGLGIAVVIVVPYAISIARRMKALASRMPRALRIPLVVGRELSMATSRLAGQRRQPALRLSWLNYAAAAFDASGVHLMTGGQKPTGLIPTSEVETIGFARVTMGSREMDAIVIRVRGDDESIDLPIVPMRLRNPLRALKPHELKDVATRIDDAIHGRAITQREWSY